MGARVLLLLVVVACVACASNSGVREYVPYDGVPEKVEPSGTRDLPLEEAFARLSWRDFVEPEDLSVSPRFVVSLAPITNERITLSRAIAARNPDTRWILRWAKDNALAVFAQAAINRSWGQDCRADFKDYTARWAVIAKKYVPLIEAAEQLELYAAIRTLVQLHNEMLVEADDVYLRLDRWGQTTGAESATPVPHPVAFRGPPYTAARAIVKVLQRAKQLEYGIEVLRLLHDAHGRVVGPDYNLLGEDFKPSEVRNLFCNAAARVGTHRIPPLPLVAPAVSKSEVYWDDWGESGRYDPSGLKRAFPLPGLGVATDPKHTPLEPDGLVDADLATVPYVRFGAHRVVAVERTASGSVRLTMTKETRRGFTLRRVDEEHVIEGEDLTGTRLIVSFPTLPSSIDVRVGDEIGVDAEPTLLHDSRVLQGVRGKVTRRVIYAAGKHIRTLVRGEDRLVAIGPY